MTSPSALSRTDFVAAPKRRSTFRGPVLKALAGMKRGCLHLELPDGAIVVYGEDGTVETGTFLPLTNPAIRIPRSAVLHVRREAFFTKCALYGDIGFAEAYIDGDWESPDLTAVVAWFILNVEHAPTLSGSSRARSLALNLLRGANRLGHLLRRNTRTQARNNIGAHYDLSNDFFALFLDSSMMYSAAKWASQGQTLANAQREKNAALCEKLRLRSTDHVLEIGTGWGGWAVQAATTHGCRVTTVTLSQEQFDFARRRVSEAGLAHRVEVRRCDYREIAGRFDKIVSIEMLEAVGHRYLPDFCAVVDRVLRPEGLVALQFITCPDARYDEFRHGVDFIQKHIFPGSLLLSLNRVNSELTRAGAFVLHHLEDLGQDYAITLRRWDDTFHTQQERVRALGFDDRFVRKWTYYLRYCEAAFALRNISVVQTVHTRANNLAL